MKRSLLLGFIFILLFQFPPAPASTASLEELLLMEIPLVVTASKKKESQDVAPNVVYVVKAEEIKKYGYRSVRDILNRVPGFFTSYKPLEPVVQVRGIAPNENNKITYMLNGHRINNVNESTDLIPPYNLDNLEQVEIIVGPGSVLYGSESLLAIVNMITKKIEGAEAVASYGSYGTVMATAMAGARVEQAEIFVSGTYAQREGYDSEAFYRHSGERIGTEGRDLLSRKIDTIRPSGSLFASAEVGGIGIQFSSMNQGIPEYSQNREALGVIATRYNYVDSLVIRRSTAHSDYWSSNFSLSYDQKRLLRAVEENYVGSTLDTTQSLYAAEAAAQYKDRRNYIQAGLQASFANNRHNYNLGQFDPSQNTTEGTASQIVDNFTQRVVGGYLSEEYQILPDILSAVAAVRGDVTNLVRNENKLYLSPRAALVFQAGPATVLKAMYNTATKFPSPWESKYNQLWNYDRGAAWASTIGPAYEPERLTTYELQAIQYAKFFGEWRFAANGYVQKLDDMIAWSSSFTNVGDFDGKGVELDVKYSPLAALDMWVNGSWQSAKFTPHLAGGDHGDLENPDGEMNAVPQLLLNLGGLYKFSKDLSLSGTVRYFNNQVVKRYPIPNYTMTRTEWDAYLTTDAYKWEKVTNVFYLDLCFVWDNLLKEGIGLRLAGKNLLDNRTRVAMQYANGDFQPEGRSLEASIFAKF